MRTVHEAGFPNGTVLWHQSSRGRFSVKGGETPGAWILFGENQAERSQQGILQLRGISQHNIRGGPAS